jgi:cytochrome d ubiquinol oxidase subunit I
MILATYVATGFAVAAIHAFFVLRGQNATFHRRALGIALAMACVSIPLQVISGDWSAKTVARLQPAKLAAMEGHYETQAAAPLTVGGIPDDEAMITRYALRIPYGLSFLAFADPQATVSGLDQFPRDEWPNTLLVHWAFDIMVASGGAMLLLAVWTAWLWLRHKRRLPDHRPWLWALVIGGPLGFIAIETGWIVTEVGRQPWIIYGLMRTAEAVTSMTGLAVPFITFTALYIILGVVLIVLLRRQFLETAEPAAPPTISEGAHGSSA